jgi:hypothetical protein
LETKSVIKGEETQLRVSNANIAPQEEENGPDHEFRGCELAHDSSALASESATVPSKSTLAHDAYGRGYH